MEYQGNFEQFIKDKEKLNDKEMVDDQKAATSKATAGIEEEEERQYELMKESISSKEKTVKSAKKGKPSISKEFDITFQDLVERPFTPLETVYHPPVFALPIHSNPIYKKYTVQERIQLMCNYHTKISELLAKVAKTSLHMASWSKAIPSASKNSKFSLESPSSDHTASDILDEIPTKDFYVSRAGRQIKRKIYTEDEDGDSESEFVTSAKKTKIPDSDVKITFESPLIFEENHNAQSTPKNVQNQGKSNATQRKSTPIPKRTFMPSKKLTRSEHLFDQMKQDNSKKQHQEEEMAKFAETLPDIDNDSDFSFDSPVKEVPEETFVRKRIIPPIPTRKTSQAKKKPDLEEISKFFEPHASPPTSPVIKRFEKSKSSESASKSKDENSSNIQKQDCPICGGLFLVSEIQAHASNCGEDDFADIPEQTHSNSNISNQITCATCDGVFLSAHTYDDHVKHCLASTIANL